jgi:hypothetical protein
LSLFHHQQPRHGATIITKSYALIRLPTTLVSASRSSLVYFDSGGAMNIAVVISACKSGGFLPLVCTGPLDILVKPKDCR